MALYYNQSMDIVIYEIYKSEKMLQERSFFPASVAQDNAIRGGKKK